ncbi:MAG: aminoglycoside nucleotidyltransferase [Firmicutes bacterium]|nr:aminoglycoside nucleotidyltransferase [Bacillota bacterium]
MMNEQDVVGLLKTIKSIGIDVWIDGGWGVDALIGHQTRSHNDIDIFIKKINSAAFTQMMVSKGYRETKMDYSTANHTVWQDSHGHIIDLHLFEFGEAGNIYYDGESYPAAILNGTGMIGDVKVCCLTAEAQLEYHQGYAITEKDIHDVFLLCKTFKLPMPPHYG